MLYLHYAVAGIGACLVPLNPRLGRAELDYIVNHARPRVLVAHERLRHLVEKVLDGSTGRRRRCTSMRRTAWRIRSKEGSGPLRRAAGSAVRGRAAFDQLHERDNGQAEGRHVLPPGAYLHALGVIAEASLSSRSRYLWTLPMFHCNGWAFTWAVTAARG